MVYGDGIAIGWLGHPEFRLGDGTLVYSRRMPSFFETFPTLFVDASGVVRADQPFRRAESKYALESKKLRVTFRGGALDGVSVSNRLTVATLARSAQFGELLDFDRESVSADGVLRTSGMVYASLLRLTLLLRALVACVPCAISRPDRWVRG